MLTTDERRPESPRLPALRIVAALVRNLRLVVGIPLATFALVVTVVIATPRQYTSTLSFTPVGIASSLGQLAAVAAQAGFSLPSGAAGESPQFYADLVRTEIILRGLATTRYSVVVKGDTVKGTLLELYEIDEATPERSLYEAVRRLREKIIAARPNRVTGVTIITVRTKWPDLSLQLAEEIRRVVNEYNVSTRTSQARFERAFLEARVDTARSDLRSAESRMQSFLVSNRTYRDDPRLLFEHDRIDRELNVRQDTYLALTRALEQARIEEVRNTPSISLVETPMRALRGDPRGTLLKGLLALFLGGLVALGIVASREFMRPRTDRPESEELEELLAEIETGLAGIPLLSRLWRRTAA
jgi:uncharacterized protein involved in exopolysaccharide biosynthesis